MCFAGRAFVWYSFYTVLCVPLAPAQSIFSGQPHFRTRLQPRLTWGRFQSPEDLALREIFITPDEGVRRRLRKLEETQGKLLAMLKALRDGIHWFSSVVSPDRRYRWNWWMASLFETGGWWWWREIRQTQRPDVFERVTKKGGETISFNWFNGQSSESNQGSIHYTPGSTNIAGWKMDPTWRWIFYKRWGIPLIG